jgi:radical SAM protein with 4Fe4S-binding SPASM domain
MDFPLADPDIASTALYNLCANSAAGSMQEHVNKVLVSRHPFFKLALAEGAGKKLPSDYAGTFYGAVGQYFSPAVFQKFQMRLAQGMTALGNSSDTHIETKLKTLAHLSGISNLNWQPIQTCLGEKWMAYFLESRDEFINLMFPRQLTIVLTYHCNRNCNYCFSLDMKEAEPGYLSDELLDIILEWVDDNEIKQVSFFGGEPTLHPRFSDIMQTFKERGYDVYFPTNGLYSDEVARSLADSDVLKVTFNIPTARDIEKAHLHRLTKNLSCFPSHIPKVFRVTLSESDRDLALLRELTAKFHPQALCAAPAFPSINQTNSYVHKYATPKFVSEIIGLADIARQQAIPCHLVKPIPLCHLSGGDLLKIFQEYVFHNTCDIRQNNYAQLTTLSPKGALYPCMALPQYRAFNIKDGPSYESIQDYNRSIVDRLDAKGLLPECFSCNLHNAKVCQGLCYAHYSEHPA